MAHPGQARPVDQEGQGPSTAFMPCLLGQCKAASEPVAAAVRLIRNQYILYLSTLLCRQGSEKDLLGLVILWASTHRILYCLITE